MERELHLCWSLCLSLSLIFHASFLLSIICWPTKANGHVLVLQLNCFQNVIWCWAAAKVTLTLVLQSEGLHFDAASEGCYLLLAFYWKLYPKRLESFSCLLKKRKEKENTCCSESWRKRSTALLRSYFSAWSELCTIQSQPYHWHLAQWYNWSR